MIARFSVRYLIRCLARCLAPCLGLQRRDSEEIAMWQGSDRNVTASYRGRFAPTPSGPLHFGSLVAALGSCLEARRHRGEWWLRIDDLDAPRVQPGAIDDILRCLERHGFQWDGPVLFQSRRIEAYHAALHRLRRNGHVYPCACSRGDIARMARPGIEGPVYPGTCRGGMPVDGHARAWRLRCADTVVRFDDAVQGPQHMELGEALGDFVLYRSDGVYAFQLASAVDDAEFGMTDIVRGADLMPSSLRQIHVLRSLGLQVPRYTHLPVALGPTGEKLSKQSHAPALDSAQPSHALAKALSFLGQHPPEELSSSPVGEIWHWARSYWRLDAVPRCVQRDAAGNAFASSDRSAGNG